METGFKWLEIMTQIRESNPSWYVNKWSVEGKMQSQIKSSATKPRENRAKRRVTRGISGWVSEPLVHPHRPLRRAPLSRPFPTFLFYFSRGDELLNDKPYYIFCGELAKVRILRPFCAPAFYSHSSFVAMYRKNTDRKIASRDGRLNLNPLLN